MQDFVDNVKNIGNVIEGQVIDIIYQKTTECRHIQQLTPDCGACTQVYDYSTHVMIRYFVETIAEQVLESGQDRQIVERGATVDFTNSDSIRLYFSGYIFPKP